MQSIPDKLKDKLILRSNEGVKRTFSQLQGVDFYSNDYLGFSQDKSITDQACEILAEYPDLGNGATGSRLLSGNSRLHEDFEVLAAKFHQSEAALLYNSGYVANLGFFGTIPQRGDIVLYDELIHTSIREGIRLGVAQSYKFQHNSLVHLEHQLQRIQSKAILGAEIYVVTESVFSMDGDQVPLLGLVKLCDNYKVRLVVDEAHAVGVFGAQGQGLVQELNLQQAVFARITTFGKAIGAHGAIILGSQLLKEYLINFSKSLIYTTALAPHSVAVLKSAYQNLQTTSKIQQLKSRIDFFNLLVKRNIIESYFIKSMTPIQCCMLGDVNRARSLADLLTAANLVCKPIFSPTVPKGQERLRICLHAYNTEAEIQRLIEILAVFLKEEK